MGIKRIISMFSINLQFRTKYNKGKWHQKKVYEIAGRIFEEEYDLVKIVKQSFDGLTELKISDSHVA